MSRMGNKVWIAMLGFSTLVLAVLTVVAVAWAIYEHDWRRALGGAIVPGVFAWRALDALQSRIKYGSAGRPPDEIEQFHVDF